MLRVLEMTDEIVVPERREDEHRRVESDAYPAQVRSIVTSRSEHPFPMITPMPPILLTADQDFESTGDPAQVRLAGVFRHATGAEDPGDVGVLGIHGEANPAVHANFQAASR